MFETGMSALVLKICSEYAKSLGLNFPPCTQQEINAICQWVDKHAVKDMTISQDGYTVTFTFKGEYDTTKEFTITIPKNVNIDELEKVLKGSDNVVVGRLADNSGLQVSLAQSVVNDINSKLTKPANPAADSAVTMTADGTVGTKPLSEISGKLYKHSIYIDFLGNYAIMCDIVNTNQTNINSLNLLKQNINSLASPWVYSGAKGLGNVTLKIKVTTLYVRGNIVDSSGNNTVVNNEVESGYTISDTVTKL